MLLKTPNFPKKSDDGDMLKRLYSMVSVSYTHLDVYKRQLYNSGTLCNVTLVGTSVIIGYFCIVFKRFIIVVNNSRGNYSV